MPTATYTPLATVTLASSAASVTFSSIPATYRDLILVIQSGAVGNDSNVRLRFNGDTGSNYSYVRMYGTGSGSGSSDSTTSTGFQAARQTANNVGGFGMGVVNIMDYSATDKHKTALVRSGLASEITMAHAARWANTAAVTSITLLGFELGTNFLAGSRFDLYGVIA
jgi:hypothetical protein